MPLYLLAAAAGLIPGLLITRRASVLLLKRVRGLFLIVPVVMAALAPFLLDRTAPELIWADDRSLLMRLILIQQSLLIMFLGVNLLPRRLPMPHRTRLSLRRLRIEITGFVDPILKGFRLAPLVRRVEPDHRPATRWWHRLPLLVILTAVVLQTAVLMNNDGYMPLTRDYLLEIDDPALVTAIEDGALLTKRLIDNQTILPQLAQSIRLPWLELLFPDAFPFYGSAQLLGAFGLFLWLTSQFVDKAPGSHTHIRHKPAPEDVEPAFKIIRIPADNPPSDILEADDLEAICLDTDDLASDDLDSDKEESDDLENDA